VWLHAALYQDGAAHASNDTLGPATWRVLAWPRATWLWQRAAVLTVHAPRGARGWLNATLAHTGEGANGADGAMLPHWVDVGQHCEL
jgi:hypothetical protein